MTVAQLVFPVVEIVVVAGALIILARMISRVRASRGSLARGRVRADRLDYAIVGLLAAFVIGAQLLLSAYATHRLF